MTEMTVGLIITMKAITEYRDSKEIITKFAEQNIAKIGYKKIYRVSLIGPMYKTNNNNLITDKNNNNNSKKTTITTKL